MATYAELRAQIEALTREAEAARKAEISQVVAEIRSKMLEFNLGIEDIAPRGASGSVRKGAPVAPKYRNPATNETWTGRGKQPRWLAAELASGKTLESFAIAAPAAAPQAA